MRSFKMKYRELAIIENQSEIADGIFSLWLCAPQIAADAAPGQFVSVYLKDKSRLLPRPISLCEIDKAGGRLRLVYRVTGKGKGTEELSAYKQSDQIWLLGPLGNGFPLKEAEGKNILLVGGGIGIPPLLETAKTLRRTSGCQSMKILAGYRHDLFLTEELREAADLLISTEDASCGTEGTVMDIIKEKKIKPDIVFACGPRPMLGALKEWALAGSLTCYISMEERMACGIGACLGCVCISDRVDSHSNVKNKRVCKDGPVFECREVEV